MKLHGVREEQPAGGLRYRDIGLDLCGDASRFKINRFERHAAEIEPQQLAGHDGVIVLTPRVTADSLAESADLLAIGRFGVGYDTVDVAVCTAGPVETPILPFIPMSVKML